MHPRISIIAALGKDRAIGKDNRLLWHIPEDLKRFKTLTLGHPVVMGRKTFESIVTQLGKPLPGRTNIVVTRDTAWRHDGVEVAHTIEDALEKANGIGQEEVFVIGGAQVYTQALPFADRLYLTLVDSDQEGDTFFPPYENIFTKKVFEEAHMDEPIPYRFVTLEK